MEKEDYYYIIIEAPYDSLTHMNRKLPVISKIRKNKFPILFKFEDRTEEGPFDSLFELKKRSLILAGVTKQKDRQKILRLKNINEITDFFIAQEGTTIEKAFFDSFTHVTIGKITKQKVKGIHFYMPDKVRIIEIIQKDDKTGVYSAKIELLNANTNIWVAKEEITTFFPDEWTVSKTFLECYSAYKTREKISGMTYKAKTQSGIPVRFIIDEKDKILTFYPILEN